MNKRVCDRCGKEIVEIKRTSFQAFCDAVAQLVLKSVGKHEIKYSIQIIDSADPKIPRPIADLCEQCEHELTAFMNYTLKAKDGNDCSLVILDEKTMKPSKRKR